MGASQIIRLICEEPEVTYDGQYERIRYDVEVVPTVNNKFTADITVDTAGDDIEGYLKVVKIPDEIVFKVVPRWVFGKGPVPDISGNEDDDVDAGLEDAIYSADFAKIFNDLRNKGYACQSARQKIAEKIEDSRAFKEWIRPIVDKIKSDIENKYGLSQGKKFPKQETWWIRRRLIYATAFRKQFADFDYVLDSNEYPELVYQLARTLRPQDKMVAVRYNDGTAQVLVTPENSEAFYQKLKSLRAEQNQYL